MDPNLFCIYATEILCYIVGWFNLYYRRDVEILTNYVTSFETIYKPTFIQAHTNICLRQFVSPHLLKYFIFSTQFVSFHLFWNWYIFLRQFVSPHLLDLFIFLRQPVRPCCLTIYISKSDPHMNIRLKFEGLLLRL